MLILSFVQSSAHKIHQRHCCRLFVSTGRKAYQSKQKLKKTIMLGKPEHENAAKHKKRGSKAKADAALQGQSSEKSSQDRQGLHEDVVITFSMLDSDI